VFDKFNLIKPDLLSQDLNVSKYTHIYIFQKNVVWVYVDVGMRKDNCTNIS
jgi:hypothetical protein